MRLATTINATLVLAISLCATMRTAGAVDARDVHVGDSDYRVVEIDLAHDTLEAHWRNSDGEAFASIEALKHWGEGQGRRLLFAANAGIYDRALQPLGLYVEDGQTRRPLNTFKGSAHAGNFSIQPNGVFYVDTHAHAGVISTTAWHDHPIDARLATQSGPMLVIDGQINPAFDAASDSLKWRSGVCAKTSQQVEFVVSRAPVSFHAFARVFRDELDCRNALYLDGTLSQLYTAKAGYAGAPAMMVKPYAGMLAVFGKE